MQHPESMLNHAGVISKVGEEEEERRDGTVSSNVNDVIIAEVLTVTENSGQGG